MWHYCFRLSQTDASVISFYKYLLEYLNWKQNQENKTNKITLVWINGIWAISLAYWVLVVFQEQNTNYCVYSLYLFKENFAFFKKDISVVNLIILYSIYCSYWFFAASKSTIIYVFVWQYCVTFNRTTTCLRII